MKAYAEFRVPESYAKEFLPANLGKNITDTVRKIRVPVESEMYERIGKIDRLVSNKNQKHFFLGWNIQRTYSKKELASAELLLLKITKTFGPTGLECGTVYNDQNACKICGSGIQQISDLILDLNTIPGNSNIARTISNEIVISQELATILFNNKATGYELKPVHHWSPKYEKKPWHQLLITSLVNVSPTTKTGIRPFDEDKDNEYRCKNGHTIGLNILSELLVYKDSWDGSSFAATKELFGVNRGLLRTYPLLVITPKIYKLLKEMNCKDFTVEVVHLIT